MSKASEKNKVLKRALWLASAELHDKGNCDCPHLDKCPDVLLIAEGYIRQAETDVDVKYGPLTYEQELAEMNSGG